MKSRSTSRLTTTMLSQLEQNEYLRVKLIQLQKISREKDEFYLSIFRQQEKVTQKVLAQLFLAQEKIKTLIRQRICNNWKQQYDTLATNIASYVKDVNCLILEYRKTKQKLQQKAYNTNDLYDYYSNTLQQCGKKFDQAQFIIEELNSKINDLKQTVKELDHELQQKLIIIEQQNKQIRSLKYSLQNNPQVQNLKRSVQVQINTIQSLKKSNKKLQKDNQALERSIKQMQKLVVEMKKQLNKKQTENKQLLQQIQHKDQLIKEAGDMVEMGQRQHQEIDGLNKRVQELNKVVKLKDEEIKVLKQQSQSNNLRKPQVQFITTFNPSLSTNPMVRSTLINNSPSSSIYSQQLHQLHLKKILQQQQMIKNLNIQLIMVNKNIQRLDKQRVNLLQRQNQFKKQIENLKQAYDERQNQFKNQLDSLKQAYDRKQSQLKKQIDNLNFKYFQLEFSSKQKQQQVKNIQVYGSKCQQQIQDWKLEMQGLYQEISNRQMQIQQLQKKLQKRQQQLNRLQLEHNDLQNKANLIEKSNYELLTQNEQLKTANYELENQNSIFEEKLRIYQKEKYQSKQNLQNLLEQFQDFVRETQQEKILQYQQKRQSLSLNSFEVQQALYIKNKTTSVIENPKIKKKNLSIDVENQQDKKAEQSFKKVQFIHTDNSNMNKTKKFNLQSFQQKANPYYNFPYSPKIGQIFESMHVGRKIPSSRW